jgi:hypothetical protein
MAGLDLDGWRGWLMDLDGWRGWLDGWLGDGWMARWLAWRWMAGLDLDGLELDGWRRILRRMPQTALLRPVLEGLAKFVHLINLEFYDDLILHLGRLVEQKVKMENLCPLVLILILFQCSN